MGKRRETEIDPLIKGKEKIPEWKISTQLTCKLLLVAFCVLVPVVYTGVPIELNSGFCARSDLR